MESPIIKKIWVFGITSVVVALVLACIGFGVVEFFKIKNEAAIKFNSQMDILVYSLQPILLFEDKEAADKTLLALQGDNSINRIRIYKSDGREFTSFIRNDRNGDVKFSRDIFFEDKLIGRLEIEAVYAGIKEKTSAYIFISLLIILISIPVSHVISAPLRKQVSLGVAQLVETTQELKRSNEDLEQFAYVASHDLQEPIRKIVGFSQLFAREFEGKMDATSQEYMNYIVDGAKRMQVLIQDLLQFSKISSGKLVIEPTDLNGVVTEAMQNLESVIQENKADIRLDSLPVIPVHRVQIVQLFQNLIGNAIKYRGSKNPEIRITAQKQNDSWAFSIRDNGIGIAPEFFEKIFVIFQRLHGKSSKYPGTGIGLAICKRTVERHGGRIWVESKPGEGTTFKFTLPERG